MIRVVAKRDDTLMLTDPAAGKGAILYRPGMEPHVVHIDTAFAAGYWGDYAEPVPELPAEILSELDDFNRRFPAPVTSPL